MKTTRDVIAAQGEPLPRDMRTKWKALKGGFHALVRWVEANLHIGGKEVSLENPVPVTSTIVTTTWRRVIDTKTKIGPYVSRPISTKSYSTIWVLLEGRGVILAQVSDNGRDWWNIPDWEMRGNKNAQKISCQGVDYIRFTAHPVPDYEMVVKIRLFR